MQSISIKELLKVIDKINIIDIRSIEKYNDNHIPNAINIPADQLVDNLDKYLIYTKTYYIYCQRGIKSIKVCNFMKKRGYNAINIIGGYEAWLLEK